MTMNGAAGVVVAGSVEFGNSHAGIVAAQEVRSGKIE